mgnify:CR=1 FL=1
MTKRQTRMLAVAVVVAVAGVGFHVVETVDGLAFEELQRLTGVPLKRMLTAA